MRKLIIILLLLNSIYSFSQSPLYGYTIKILDQAEYIANYTLTFREDSLNIDKSRQQEFFLFLENNISRFIGKHIYNINLESRKITTKAQLHEWISRPHEGNISSRFLYEFHKNYPDGKITCYHHITSGPFLYEEELNLFDWQLTNITDTIAGYKVQRATTDFGGRSWIAWFSSEIPYNDGPYKFNGLPGLIVKIYDTKNHYVFELTSIEKPEKTVDIEFIERDYFKTTKTRFFRAEDYARDNIVSTVKAMGNGPESQQIAAKVMAARNNPIELKRK